MESSVGDLGIFEVSVRSNEGSENESPIILYLPSLVTAKTENIYLNKYSNNVKLLNDTSTPMSHYTNMELSSPPSHYY